MSIVNTREDMKEEGAQNGMLERIHHSYDIIKRQYPEKRLPKLQSPSVKRKRGKRNCYFVPFLYITAINVLKTYLYLWQYITAVNILWQ